MALPAKVLEPRQEMSPSEVGETSSPSDAVLRTEMVGLRSLIATRCTPLDRSRESFNTHVYVHRSSSDAGQTRAADGTNTGRDGSWTQSLEFKVERDLLYAV